MKFLSRFLATCRAFWTPTAEVVREKAAEEPSALLARYILESNRITGGGANHRAFMPPPDFELSTFNIDNLDSQEIWAIGETVRAEQKKASLYGRADLQAKSVYDADLRPVRDDKPPRHVVIVAWPTDKAQIKNRAQLLAAASTYVPR